ncbi:hypothetical protein QQP08_018992, partial [Theobroma cacao]
LVVGQSCLLSCVKSPKPNSSSFSRRVPYLCCILAPRPPPHSTDCSILPEGIIPSRRSSQASAPIEIHLPRLGSLCKISMDPSLPSRLGSSCQDLDDFVVILLVAPSASSPPMKFAHTFSSMDSDAAC